jgi:hypothetical protein
MISRAVTAVETASAAKTSHPSFPYVSLASLTVDLAMIAITAAPTP